MKYKKIAASAAAAAALLLVFTLSEARRLIVDEVRVDERTDCSTIRVSFNFPVRYVKHFPYSRGDELRIQLEPIRTTPAERETLFSRETVFPPANAVVGLSEVLYEGDVDGGPFLTLFFRRETGFSVGQGADYRSIVVTVAGREAAGPCAPSD